MRKKSIVAPDWWDYTTLDRELLEDAAELTAEDVLQMSRPGFTVKSYDTLESAGRSGRPSSFPWSRRW